MQQVYTLRQCGIKNQKIQNNPELIFHLLPVREKVEETEMNRMRNGYIIDTLTSVDEQEIVKLGVK